MRVITTVAVTVLTLGMPAGSHAGADGEPRYDLATEHEQCQPVGDPATINPPSQLALDGCTPTPFASATATADAATGEFSVDASARSPLPVAINLDGTPRPGSQASAFVRFYRWRVQVSEGQTVTVPGDVTSASTGPDSWTTIEDIPVQASQSYTAVHLDVYWRGCGSCDRSTAVVVVSTNGSAPRLGPFTLGAPGGFCTPSGCPIVAPPGTTEATVAVWVVNHAIAHGDPPTWARMTGNVGAPVIA